MLVSEDQTQDSQHFPVPEHMGRLDYELSRIALMVSILQRKLEPRSEVEVSMQPMIYTCRLLGHDGGTVRVQTSGSLNLELVLMTARILELHIMDGSCGRADRTCDVEKQETSFFVPRCTRSAVHTCLVPFVNSQWLTSYGAITTSAS